METPDRLRNIVEAALLAAGRPLSLDALQTLFDEGECPDKNGLRSVLAQLVEDYAGRGIEVTEVSSGWRIQVRQDCSPWVSRLWDERPARYSRALMETLALIAYRQPITRGEIEDIRGVSVSTNIIKSLLEREWVRVVGHRDVPGRPSLYGTTREFLDYFCLKSLDDLPTLAELRDLDEINRELDLESPDAPLAPDAAGEADALNAADGSPAATVSQPEPDPGADNVGPPDSQVASGEVGVAVPETNAEAGAGQGTAAAEGGQLPRAEDQAANDDSDAASAPRTLDRDLS